jgi:hypothetical protein
MSISATLAPCGQTCTRRSRARLRLPLEIMSGRRLAPMVTVLCASLASCGGGSRAAVDSTHLSRASATAGIVGCPLTVPNGRRPPGEEPSPQDHGNGALWTSFPLGGRIVARPPFIRRDGSMRIKFPWWGSRIAGGELKITSRSLDRPGRFAGAGISPGQTGAPHFWASAIIFPTEGCWRINGTAGRASLTFVVSVTRAPSA